MDIVSGAVFKFHILAFKNGVQVPVAQPVTADATNGSVAVNPDGTGGVFTAGDPGQATLVAYQDQRDQVTMKFNVTPKPSEIRIIPE